MLAFFRGRTNALVLSGSRQTSYTAVLGPSGWRRVETGSAEPSRRQCAAMAYHESLGAGVFHGGELHHGGELLADTWLLHPPV